MRVSSFQSGTAEDFSKAVNALKSQSGGKLKGLFVSAREQVIADLVAKME